MNEKFYTVMEISRDDVIAAFLILGIEINPTDRQVEKIAKNLRDYIVMDLLGDDTKAYLEVIRKASDEVLLLDSVK